MKYEFWTHLESGITYRLPARKDDTRERKLLRPATDHEVQKWVQGQEDDRPALSVHFVLRVAHRQIVRVWDDHLSDLEHLMGENPDRLTLGGGLYGVAPEYHSVKAGLIAEGKEILRLEAEELRLPPGARRERRRMNKIGVRQQ